METMYHCVTFTQRLNGLNGRLCEQWLEVANNVVEADVNVEACKNEGFRTKMMLDRENNKKP